MKLYFSSSSPFVRKVMVSAHELGLADQIETIPAAPHPVKRDLSIRGANPLAQIPTLVTGEGDSIFDSRVICEYLDAKAKGNLFGSGQTRWRNLTQAAMGDGLLGAALLVRYESVARPPEFGWEAWIAGQMAKVTDVLDRLEQIAPQMQSRVDIAAITFGCGLSYLDFRYPEVNWRQNRPHAAKWFEEFNARPSMTATKPSA